MDFKKNFWVINFIISIVLIIGFFSHILFIISTIEDLNINTVWLYILGGLLICSTLQFIVCLIYFFIKIKPKPIKKILILIWLASIICIEVSSSFALLAGFLG